LLQNRASGLHHLAPSIERDAHSCSKSLVRCRVAVIAVPKSHMEGRDHQCWHDTGELHGVNISWLLPVCVCDWTWLVLSTTGVLKGGVRGTLTRPLLPTVRAPAPSAGSCSALDDGPGAEEEPDDACADVDIDTDIPSSLDY
jgi:hypothetical protein